MKISGIHSCFWSSYLEPSLLYFCQILGWYSCLLGDPICLGYFVLCFHMKVVPVFKAKTYFCRQQKDGFYFLIHSVTFEWRVEAVNFIILSKVYDGVSFLFSLWILKSCLCFISYSFVCFCCRVSWLCPILSKFRVLLPGFYLNFFCLDIISFLL